MHWRCSWDWSRTISFAFTGKLSKMCWPLFQNSSSLSSSRHWTSNKSSTKACFAKVKTDYIRCRHTTIHVTHSIVGWTIPAGMRRMVSPVMIDQSFKELLPSSYIVSYKQFIINYLTLAPTFFHPPCRLCGWSPWKDLLTFLKRFNDAFSWLLTPYLPLTLPCVIGTIQRVVVVYLSTLLLPSVCVESLMAPCVQAIFDMCLSYHHVL